MKVLALFIIDFIVLIALLCLTYALVGELYREGGFLTQVLIMAVVGGVYGFLRSIYWKWILRNEESSES